MLNETIHILALNETDARSNHQFGGKAGNLGDLLRIGITVPPGVAVGRDVLAHFLRVNGIDLASVERVHTLGMTFLETALAEASELQKRIVDVILNAPFPSVITDLLLEKLEGLTRRATAIRSSCVVEDALTTSFAGQYVTVLNVAGWKNILDAIRACWASQYDGRALTYAIEHRGMPVLSPCMAVLIQQMLSPDFAGVCFTVGPTPQTKDCLIVESVPGCGESLVSGTRTPCHFEVTQGQTIRKARVPVAGTIERPPNELIFAVSETANCIARHFGTAQDVEWAAVNGEIFILQARPITVAGTQRKGGPISLASATAKSVCTCTPEAVVSFGSALLKLRDDMYEWLLTKVDPLVFRGACYLLSAQHPDGSWSVEGHPEWDQAVTAFVIQILLAGGIPTTLQWAGPNTKDNSNVLGLPLAVGWLVKSVNADGSWGSDLWDTCQVILALLKCGVPPSESVLKRAIEFIVADVERGLTSYSQQEWFGSGFLAAALRIFSETGDRDNARKCVMALLDAQFETGDFCGPVTKPEGTKVPSEWHTAQAVIALARYDGPQAEREKIANATDRACDWLVRRQRENGSWGVQAPPYSMYSTTFTGYATIALSHSPSKYSDAISRSLKWLKAQQVSSGAFGDIGSCVMAMAAFQALRGQAFAFEIPIPIFLRVQTTLGSEVARYTKGSRHA